MTKRNLTLVIIGAYVKAINLNILFLHFNVENYNYNILVTIINGIPCIITFKTNTKRRQ